MAFGMDYDGTLVSVVGQYRTQGLDATGFDALLREATAGAEELRPRLEALFVELLAEEKSSGPESQAQAGAVLEDSSLSDHDRSRRLVQGKRLLERSALKKGIRTRRPRRAAPRRQQAEKSAFFREAKAAYG